MFKIFITCFIIALSAGFFVFINGNQALNDQLFAAVRDGNTAKVRLALSNGADIHSKDGAGQTALHSAVYHGNTEISALLVRYGANVNIKDNRGGTPLHWAALQKNKKNIRLLVKHGAKLNVEDKFYMTPLHWAVAQNKQTNVKILLELGANPIARNSQGKSALDIAKGKKNMAILSILRSTKNDE